MLETHLTSRIWNVISSISFGYHFVLKYTENRHKWIFFAFQALRLLRHTLNQCRKLFWKLISHLAFEMKNIWHFDQVLFVLKYIGNQRKWSVFCISGPVNCPGINEFNAGNYAGNISHISHLLCNIWYFHQVPFVLEIAINDHFLHFWSCKLPRKKIKKCRKLSRKSRLTSRIWNAISSIFIG